MRLKCKLWRRVEGIPPPPYHSPLPPPRAPSASSLFALLIGRNIYVCVSESVRNLGVTIDSTMSFDQHVDNILQNIVLSHSCTPSHQKPCHDCTLKILLRLLYGTSTSNIKKLQQVQNRTDLLSLVSLLDEFEMSCHAHSCRLALASSVLENWVQSCTLDVQDNDDTTTYLPSRIGSTA